MKKQLVSVRSVGALIVCALVSGQAAVAQTSAQGWPDSGDAKPVVSKAPDAKQARASSPAASAAVKPAAMAPKPVAAAVKPVAVMAKAAEARSESAIVAPAASLPAAAAVVSTDLVQALQQQSDVLARLASDLETQRKVIADQDHAIATLQTRLAATASPAAAVPEAKAPAPAPAAPPIVLVDTNGAKLKIGGLVQGWFTAGDGGVVDTFRLRRTELKISGEINPKAKWTVMLDPAKSQGVSNSYVTMNGQKVLSDTSVSQSGRVLQDAFLSLNYSPAFSVELGQQKIPLAMEGVQSSAKLDVAERALFMTDKARGGGFGDIRDFGVIVRGKIVSGQVEYSGGFFNGLGETMNDVDKNYEKPFVGRVVLRPKRIPGLQFGGSMARTSFGDDDSTFRDRRGFEAAYTHGIFTAKSELMMAQDGAISRRGYYLHTGARVHKSLEVVFRHDVFDPDTHNEETAATVTERDWLTGANWFVAGPNVVLQFDYVRKTFASVQAPRNVFMTNLQTSW